MEWVIVNGVGDCILLLWTFEIVESLQSPFENSATTGFGREKLREKRHFGDQNIQEALEELKTSDKTLCPKSPENRLKVARNSRLAREENEDDQILRL